MNEITYFAPGFSSIEDIEEEYGEIYDATSLSKIITCPRHHQIKVEERLTEPGDSAPMVAGIAIHAALEYYYAAGHLGPEAERMALELCRDEWNRFNIDPSSVPEKHSHLTLDHLLGVLRGYFQEWNINRIEIFEPLRITSLDDMDLSQVVGARFRLNSAGNIILGESNLIMRFEVDGDPFVLAGKPDLPVRDQMGSLWAMDHKTTSSSLSDWWAKKHEMSNKDRGYMAMLASLLGTPLRGAIINAIYVGKYALNPASRATKFHRFSFPFTEGHVEEAIRNQYTWIKTIKFYRDLGYWPQGCDFGGCKQPALCKRDPATRDLVKMDPTLYIPNTRNFWDL